MPKSAYEKAGVSIDRGNQAVERIKSMVKNMGVQEIGKFGGFFPLKGGLKNPILVSSADGVGTKLKIAFLMNVHNTVGRDLVNHCVNDILVYGARPLFFLDYLAAGRVEPETVGEVVSGLLDGCLDNEMVLLGGETAEMPGFYRQVIILYKFGQVEPLKHILADLYLETVRRELPGAFDAVVPVPADLRRRRNGFQPVRVAGKVLARRLGVPFRPGLLLKRKATPPQVGLTQAQRLANLDGAFALGAGARAAGLRVLLVDDVTTTGTTVRKCAAVLKRGGARVTALTLGQTRR
jgi:predicted amidophosphoribosyltransferase